MKRFKLLKSTTIIFLYIFISAFISNNIRFLYNDWRHNLYDTDCDGIFISGNWRNIFEMRTIGLPPEFGVIVLSPVLFLFIFVILAIAQYLKGKNIKFFISLKSFYDKTLGAFLGKEIKASRIIVQIAISFAIEILAVAIFYITYFKRIAPNCADTLMRPDTFRFLIFFSTLCYAFSLLSILMAKRTFKSEAICRVFWIYQMVDLLELVVSDFIGISKDSFLFMLIPISVLIPLCTISLRSVNQNQKSISSIHFFKFFAGLYILIRCLYSFLPFNYPFEPVHLIEYKRVRNIIIALYLIITGLLKFSIAEKIYGIIKKYCLEKR